jgi:hypothetical protein
MLMSAVHFQNGYVVFCRVNEPVCLSTDLSWISGLFPASGVMDKAVVNIVL